MRRYSMSESDKWLNADAEALKRERLYDDYIADIDERIAPKLSQTLGELRRLIDEYNELGLGLDYAEQLDIILLDV